MNKLLKRTGFLILILCLSFVSVACSKNEKGSNKEATQNDSKETKNVQLEDGYSGVEEITFPVPYGNDETNSDYDEDDLSFGVTCPSSFSGIIGNDIDCRLYIDAKDISDVTDTDSMTTDDISDVVKNIYMVTYKMDFNIVDQKNIELPGLGIKAVQNTLFVKGSAKDFDHNDIETYFVYNKKLYKVCITRYHSEFSYEEISEYDTLLQGIEKVNYE